MDVARGCNKTHPKKDGSGCKYVQRCYRPELKTRRNEKKTNTSENICSIMEVEKIHGTLNANSNGYKQTDDQI